MASGNTPVGKIVTGMRYSRWPDNCAAQPYGKGFPRIMKSSLSTRSSVVTVKEKGFASKPVLHHEFANRIGTKIAYFVGIQSAGIAPGLCGPIVLTRRDGACCPR